MNRIRSGVICVTGAVGLIACAGAAATGGGGNATTPSLPGDYVWTGVIRSVNQFRFAAPDSTRDRSFGALEWTAGSGPTVSNITMTFTYGGNEKNLSWAVLFGRCGSASLPVAPLGEFPELDVSGGGRGRADLLVPVELPQSGNYHVEVYKDRSGGAASIVGCGNLKRVDR